jgi:hypothetical protein
VPGTAAVLLVAAVLIGPDAAYGTDTLDCEAGDYLIRMHVNTEDAIADLLLYRGEKTLATLWTRDLDVARLDWEAQDVEVERRTNRRKRPSFSLRVKGGKGLFRMGDIRVDATCDWER